MQVARSLILCFSMCLLSQAGFARNDSFPRYLQAKEQCPKILAEQSCIKKPHCMWTEGACVVDGDSYAVRVYAGVFCLGFMTAVVIGIPAILLYQILC